MINQSGRSLIQVRNLVKYFPISAGFPRRVRDWVRAVDDVSFDIASGQTLGLVGESGSGKTTLGRSLLHLIEPTSGSVRFDNVELSELSRRELRALRRDMQYIFQDPTSSLDPTMPIGEIILEGPKIHGIGTEVERQTLLVELLSRVGLNHAYAGQLPHSFSGGQRQRIGIARALALNPRFIIADEPVTALDPSLQAQMLNLLNELQDEFGLTYLVIAHDLTVVEHVSNQVAVMYRGKIVELGNTSGIFNNPLHPYTQLLLASGAKPAKRTKSILEEPSPLTQLHAGCCFHPRCPECLDEICPMQEPPLIDAEVDHWVACWLHPGEDQDSSVE